MPAVQLTKGTTQVATATVAIAALAAAGTNTAANITLIRGISLASATTQFVPTAEYWYITGIYLPGATAPTGMNALLLTFVNSAPQPFAPAESEVSQTIFNKLTLPPQEWIQLPNGQQWQQAIQPQVANTSTTTVTFQETILRMPLASMQ